MRRDPLPISRRNLEIGREKRKTIDLGSDFI